MFSAVLDSVPAGDGLSLAGAGVWLSPRGTMPPTPSFETSSPFVSSDLLESSEQNSDVDGGFFGGSTDFPGK